MTARRLVLALLTTLLVASPALAAPRDPAGSPGADGIGDRLFPQLGNGGYDAKHYDLAFTYASSAPEQDVSGKVTMLARSTQSLSSFDLDFAGDSVAAVRVDGRSADFAPARAPPGRRGGSPAPPRPSRAAAGSPRSPRSAPPTGAPTPGSPRASSPGPSPRRPPTTCRAVGSRRGTCPSPPASRPSPRRS